ncbi:MAG: hypothetical protein ABI675_03320 [Chitinophagaceae bacterium]
MSFESVILDINAYSDIPAPTGQTLPLNIFPCKRPKTALLKYNIAELDKNGNLLLKLFRAILDFRNTDNILAMQKIQREARRPPVLFFDCRFMSELLFLFKLKNYEPPVLYHHYNFQPTAVTNYKFILTGD